jgi:hypothetical protein
MREHFKRLAPIVLAGHLFACGLGPHRVSFDDSLVGELLTAVKAVDRTSLGFTPIEPSAKLWLETRPRRGYDAMLHVYGKTSRTIAFRRAHKSYEWIGEQEIFEGPHEYDSPDGRFHEQITITYEIVPIALVGFPPGQLHIEYWGDDARLHDLSIRGHLSLDAIRPTLIAWGYLR